MKAGSLIDAAKQVSGSGGIAVRVGKEIYELDHVIICHQDDGLILVTKPIPPEDDHSHAEFPHGPSR